MRDDNIVTKKQKLEPYQETAYCEPCLEEGEESILAYQNIVLTMYPALYPHQCPTCGDVQNLWNTYPRIIYEEVPNE